MKTPIIAKLCAFIGAIGMLVVGILALCGELPDVRVAGGLLLACSVVMTFGLSMIVGCAMQRGDL